MLFAAGTERFVGIGLLLVAQLTSAQFERRAGSDLRSQHGLSSSHSECYHLHSYYRRLYDAGASRGCMSANTVWHLLEGVHNNPHCYDIIIHFMQDTYSHVPTDHDDGCTCFTTSHLVDKAQLPDIHNGYYHMCRDQHHTSYDDIEHQLFTHISHHGCRNHNYVWPLLSGVKDIEANGHHHDCTLDLVTRFTVAYPHTDDDPCQCHKGATVHNTHTTATYDCSVARCLNGGTCHPVHSGYICDCPKDWIGLHCETALTTGTQSFTSKTVRTTPVTMTPTNATTPLSSLSAQTSPSTNTVTFSEYTCNKYEAIEDIAKTIHVTHPDSTMCDSHAGGSDDAYTIVACNMTSPSTWLKGINVMNDCRSSTPHIPTYIPIATFSPSSDKFIPLGAQSGIFLGCHGNGFRMAVQKCNGVPQVITVENGIFVNDPYNYFTIV